MSQYKKLQDKIKSLLAEAGINECMLFASDGEKGFTYAKDGGSLMEFMVSACLDDDNILQLMVHVLTMAEMLLMDGGCSNSGEKTIH